MCGCNANFSGEDVEFDNFSNRPSEIEVSNFVGNRPSIVEVGEDPSFDFMGDLDGNTEFDSFLGLGKKAKEKREIKKLAKASGATNKEAKQIAKDVIASGGNVTKAETGVDPTLDPNVDTKNAYGSNWFGRNWHWLAIGAVVAGAGYYIYKKRK